MTSRLVVWSNDALDDIDGIIAYIAEQNPVAVLKVIARIEKTGNNLGAMAIGHRGRVEDTYEVGVSGHPYIIAYAIHSLPGNRESIVILRIIHGARDWRKDKWPE